MKTKDDRGAMDANKVRSRPILDHRLPKSSCVRRDSIEHAGIALQFIRLLEILHRWIV